jgi:aspartate/methionine/tyrosine aminotransferase
MIAHHHLTVTHVERRAFDVALNLADGHVRRSPVVAEQQVLEDLASIYHESLCIDPRLLERRMVASLMQTLGQSRPSDDQAPLVFFSGSEALTAIGFSLRSRGRRAAVIEPTFDNIPALIQAAGVECTPIGEDVLADMDSLAGILKTVDSLVLTLPNNPTGLDLSRDEFATIAALCVEYDCALVCDCSFRAYSEQAVDMYEIFDAMPELEWMVLEDTGKLWAANDLKAGILRCSSGFHDAASRVFHDLVLSISPFVLNLLYNFSERAGVAGVQQIRELIAVNRRVIRSSLEDHAVFRVDVGSNLLSIERLFYDDRVGVDQDEFVAGLLGAGVAVTGSNGYFWAGSEHQTFIRLALARDPGMVQSAVSMLSEWTHSSYEWLPPAPPRTSGRPAA